MQGETRAKFGRLSPLSFSVRAVLVYFAGLAAILLLSTPVMEHAGVWAYVAVQAMLNVVWVIVHARRLKDSGRGPASALFILLPNVLLQVALVFATGGFAHLQATAATEQASGVQGPASTWIGLGLIYLLFGMLFQSPPLEPVWDVFRIAGVVAAVMIGSTLMYSIWVATRQRRA